MNLDLYDRKKQVEDYLKHKFFNQSPPQVQQQPVEQIPVEQVPIYTPEERAKIENTPDYSSMGGELLAGLGDVLASAYGKTPTNFSQSAKEASLNKKKSALDLFDQNKKTSENKILSEYFQKKYGIPASTNLEVSEKLAKLKNDEDLKRMTVEQANVEKESARSYRDLLRQERFDAQREKSDLKKEQQDEKMQAELSKRLGDPQNIVSSLNVINDNLGFNVDDYDPNTGTVKGKKVDLPGVSIPGIGRITAYDTRARQLKSSMARLFNLELKDRSGTAVTPTELLRLKDEFNSGKFNTEPELLKALQDYKYILRNHLKNTEAGFKPEIVDTYKNRGGITSQDLPEKTAVPTWSDEEEKRFQELQQKFSGKK
jgi:hypothetical protein